MLTHFALMVFLAWAVPIAQAQQSDYPLRRNFSQPGGTALPHANDREASRSGIRPRWPKPVSRAFRPPAEMLQRLNEAEVYHRRAQGPASARAGAETESENVFGLLGERWKTLGDPRWS